MESCIDGPLLHALGAVVVVLPSVFRLWYNGLNRTVRRNTPMPTETLEERVSELEKKVARLLEEKSQAPDTTPRWERIFGTFANSEGFEEAVRLGREYRESLRPKDEEDNT
jgi:hypothetical protein